MRWKNLRWSKDLKRIAFFAVKQSIARFENNRLSGINNRQCHKCDTADCILFINQS